MTFFLQFSSLQWQNIKILMHGSKKNCVQFQHENCKILMGTSVKKIKFVPKFEDQFEHGDKPS